MKKIMSYLLASSLVLSSLTTVLADDSAALAGLDGHWAKNYITYLYNKDVILPTGDSFTPDTEISRAEFMRYINRAFSIEGSTSISYSDVPSGTWYYDEVSKAVYWGYMQGSTDNTMKPLNKLTREEAVVIIARLHNIAPASNTSLSFVDAAKIQDWAAPYVKACVDLGYISGRNDNSFDPQGYVTRGEIAKILNLFAGDILETGTTTGAAIGSGNVTIGESGTVLRDARVKGNLLITSSGTVTLDNVTVDGEIIVSGGTLIFEDVITDDLTVKAPQTKATTITTKGATEIDNVDVYTKVTIDQTDDDGIANIVEDFTYPGQDIILTGDYDKITLTSKTLLDLKDGEVTTMQINSGAKYSEIDLDNVDIKTAHILSEVEFTGDGTIEDANITADNVYISKDIDVEDYSISRGYEAEIGGKTVDGDGSSGSTESYVVPYAIVIKEDKSIDDITFEIDEDHIDISDVEAVNKNNSELDEEEDYKLYSSDNEIKFYESFIETLDEDDEIIIEIDGEDDFTIPVIELSDDENIIWDDEMVIDPSDEDDLEVSLFTYHSDEEIDDIENDDENEDLASGDYDFEDGILTIDWEYFDELDDDTYKFIIKMAEGDDVTFEVEVDGGSGSSSNDDENRLSEDEVDFNTSSSHSDNGDIEVRLYIEDGYLKDISVDGDELEEDEDYEVAGNYYTFYEQFLDNYPDEDYIDIEFDMSSGEDPEFRVLINGYEGSSASGDDIVITVEDHRGDPIEDATVKISFQGDIYRGYTDDDGEVVFREELVEDNTDMSWKIEVEANGYEDGGKNFKPEDETEITIEMQKE